MPKLILLKFIIVIISQTKKNHTVSIDSSVLFFFFINFTSPIKITVVIVQLNI